MIRKRSVPPIKMHPPLDLCENGTLAAFVVHQYLCVAIGGEGTPCLTNHFNHSDPITNGVENATPAPIEGYVRTRRSSRVVGDLFSPKGTGSGATASSRCGNTISSPAPAAKRQLCPVTDPTKSTATFLRGRFCARGAKTRDSFAAARQRLPSLLLPARRHYSTHLTTTHLARRYHDLVAIASAGFYNGGLNAARPGQKHQRNASKVRIGNKINPRDRRLDERQG
jgi:hypothetical protein